MNRSIGVVAAQVAPVPYEDYFETIAAVPGHLQVDLGHQRTGGVENPQIPLQGFLLYRLGDTVGTENNRIAIRYLGQFVNENSTTLFQIVHHETVVNHLMAHIDGCAECVQGLLYYFDGAIHPGTKTAWIGK